MEQFLKEDGNNKSNLPGGKKVTLRVPFYLGLGDFVSKFAQHYKNRWSICGDEFIVREWWGEPEPVVHRFKLNQETNFNMPGWPNGKMLVTQRGPAKFTMNIKMPEGKSQEWKLDFCDKGMMQVRISKKKLSKASHLAWLVTMFSQEGKNLKTGTTCKIWCERFHDICGKWKPVAITGVKEGLMNLGKFINMDKWFKWGVLVPSNHFQDCLRPCATSSRTSMT